jgi:hypothetical protein
MKREFVWGRAILNVVIHLAAWSAFIVLLYLLMTKDMRSPNELALKNNPYFIFNQVFTNAFLVLFFYLNSFILIPKLLANKQILWYALIVIAALALYLYVPEYVFLKFIFHPRPAPPPGIVAGPPRHRFRIFTFLGSASLFLLIFVISSGSKILQQWFNAERQKEKAEKETLASELSLLKSQVNPHFLFNTLNNIYAMAITESEHTADAVMKLSQMMRYMLEDAEHELVPLQKDLEFVQRYIDLQKFRLSDKVDLRYQVQGDGALLQIAPMLMIPFIENAFKYGVSTREKSSILIDIQIRGNIVTLSVENTKHVSNTANSMDNTGIGINNARRRLALLYPGKHELMIQDMPAMFMVTLKITCG